MIVRFRGSYSFLSNFYPGDETSLEHAYQAAKTLNIEEQRGVLAAHTPGRAKQLGQRVTLRLDWEEVRVGIMEVLLRRKFQDPALRQRLLDTGSHHLVEGNNWHDNEWGVCYCATCPGVGENMLGKLLMKIRSGHRVQEEHLGEVRW